ncbi:hypothetical protein BC829DRAFT_286513 [Chytridium lagenaria]|nr:hypothetical protein BC829DRAFT_286513 [Chytridium lagenaria]
MTSGLTDCFSPTKYFTEPLLLPPNSNPTFTEDLQTFLQSYFTIFPRAQESIRTAVPSFFAFRRKRLPVLDRPPPFTIEEPSMRRRMKELILSVEVGRLSTVDAGLGVAWNPILQFGEGRKVKNVGELLAEKVDDGRLWRAPDFEFPEVGEDINDPLEEPHQELLTTPPLRKRPSPTLDDSYKTPVRANHPFAHPLTSTAITDSTPSKKSRTSSGKRDNQREAPRVVLPRTKLEFLGGGGQVSQEFPLFPYPSMKREVVSPVNVEDGIFGVRGHMNFEASGEDMFMNHDAEAFTERDKPILTDQNDESYMLEHSSFMQQNVPSFISDTNASMIQCNEPLYTTQDTRSFINQPCYATPSFSTPFPSRPSFTPFTNPPSSTSSHLIQHHPIRDIAAFTTTPHKRFTPPPFPISPILPTTNAHSHPLHKRLTPPPLPISPILPTTTTPSHPLHKHGTPPPNSSNTPSPNSPTLPVSTNAHSHHTSNPSSQRKTAF